MALPDQSGRVALVTGANSGIGLETATALAAAGATVVLASRDAARGDAAVADVRARAGAGADDRVSGVRLDLASFASIHGCAEEVLARHDRLHLLVNNAGLVLSERRRTEEGFEMTFGVNHLGHFLLTRLLLDRLVASAPARVVTLASTAHRMVRGLDFEDLQSDLSYQSMIAYGRSKLANILFTRELARRQEGTGVSAFAVHPGGVRSGFGKDGDTKGVARIGWLVVQPFLITPRAAAAAPLHAATEPGLEASSGAYFSRRIGGNFGPVQESSPSVAARDDAAAAELWEVSEALVGLADA